MNEEKKIEVAFKKPEFKEQMELGAHWSFKAYPIINGETQEKTEAMFWFSIGGHIAYVMDMVNGDVEKIERTNGMRELQDKCKDIIRSHYRDEFEESVKEPRDNFIEWFFRKGR